MRYRFYQNRGYLALPLFLLRQSSGFRFLTFFQLFGWFLYTEKFRGGAMASFPDIFNAAEAAHPNKSSIQWVGRERNPAIQYVCALCDISEVSGMLKRISRQ